MLSLKFNRIPPQKFGGNVAWRESIELPPRHPLRGSGTEGRWFVDKNGVIYVIWRAKSLMGGIVNVIGTSKHGDLPAFREFIEGMSEVV